MGLVVVQESGVKVVVGPAGSPFMSSLEDVSRVVEACLSADTDLVAGPIGVSVDARRR